MSPVLSTSDDATMLLVVAVGEGGGEVDMEGVGDRQYTDVERGLESSVSRSRTSYIVRDGVRAGVLF